MITYYHLFFEKVPFPEEGQSFLLSAGEALIRRAGSALEELTDRFYQSDFDIDVVEKQVAVWAEELEQNRYTVILITLICASRNLREEYRNRGYDEALFWATMTDFRAKAQECRDVMGVWGTFVGFWYPNIFRCRIFRLGRLEFETDTWRLETDVTIQGRKILPQDPVLNVHIPSGEPMDIGACMESFRMAYAFFRDGEKKPLLCRCGSWLLYGDLIQTLPEQGNIRRFYNLWKVYDIRRDPGSEDLWRIFGGAVTKDPRQLPGDTSLQRAIRNWLIQGNALDHGRGVLLFDGERVITQ